MILARGSERWPRWLTKAGANEYSSLSVRTIERLCANGTLNPSRLVAGKLLIDRNELDAVILGRTATEKKVTVNSKAESDKLSTISIRVGTFGDKDLSQLIFDTIKKNL